MSVEEMKAKAELIAGKMREVFPHVHTNVIAENVIEWKAFTPEAEAIIQEVMCANTRSALFIVSDIPYDRRNTPSNNATLMITDVLGYELSHLPDAIAEMKRQYDMGYEARMRQAMGVK